MTWGLVAMLVASAAMAVSPSHPGESSDAAFGGRRGPVDPLGTAILNVDSGATFADLQTAIDAATAGDTLQVQVPEHFEGQVMIDKDLILEGQTGSEVVKMAVDTGSSGDDRAWFLVDAGVDLTVRQLTFDGDGHLVFQAFRHRGGGRFEDCAFEDIQFNSDGPDFAGTAIVAFGSDVDVVGCRFADIGRVGVLAFGTGITGSRFDGNVYQGKGDGPHLDYGLEVGAGAVVTAVQNHVHGNTGTPPDNSASSAVLATTFFGAGTTLDLESNDLGENTYSLVVGFDDTDTSMVTASLNRLAGNTTGAVNQVSTNSLAAEFNWWGCNAGPGFAGCDPLAGSGTVTFDPWVILEGDFAVDPAQVPAGDSLPLSGFLVLDSDLAPLPGDVADGIVMSFDGGSLGSVDPATAATAIGIATTTWTAGAVPGTDVAAVELDSERVEVPVEVLPAIDVIEIPTLGGQGLALMGLLLLVLAIGRLRHGLSPTGE